MPRTDDTSLGPKNRKDRSSRSVRRPPFFAILLISGFLLLVLSFITFRQLRAGEANRLRLLAGFAEQVEATVPVLTESFVGVVEAIQEDVNRAESRLCRPEAAGSLGGRVERCLRDRLRYVPNVSLVNGPCRPQAGEAQEFVVDPYGPRVFLAYPTVFEGGSSVESCDRTTPPAVQATARQSQERSDEADGDEAEAARDDLGERPPPPLDRVRYLARLDLDTVVQPIVIPDVFDLLVVARREDGAVLFQDGEPELKLAEVDAAWEVRQRGLAETIRSAWQEASAGEPTGGGTRVVETDIAGRSYRIFLQPLTLHLVNAEGNPVATAEWVACGIVSWDRLLSSSLTTSPVLLFLMVATFPLLLVTWPFLKMWLISRDQPFTRFDVAALVFSTLIGLSLVTLLVLYFDLSSRVEATADEQLESLARRVDDALRAEVTEAAELLVKIQSLEDGDDDPDSTLRKKFVDFPPVESTGVRTPALSSVPSTERSLWEAVDSGLADDRKLFSLPFLHSVVWLDEEGEQESKIPFHRDAVLRNSVRSRAYFHCPQRLELSDLPSQGPVARVDWAAGTLRELPGAPGPLCLQSIRSQTTAGDLAVVSLPAVHRPRPSGGEDDTATKDDFTPAVVALTARLASVAHPLLPPGFSFAVIDRQGRVAFHSDARRNVVENFHKTADDDQVLVAMARDQREGPVQLNYWGERYRAWVRPLAGAPWNLVTLRTTRDLRIRSFELAYDFSIPFLLVTGGLGVLLLACFLFLPRERLQLLWPSRRYVPRYRRLVLCTPAALALFGVVLQVFGPGIVFAACVLIPFLLFPLAFLGAGIDTASDGKPRFFRGSGAGAFRNFGQAAADRIKGLRGVEALLLATSVVVGLSLASHGFGTISTYLGAAACAAAVGYFLYLRAFEEQTSVAPYVAAVASAFFALAVLPALGFFHLAESRQTQLLVQDTQVGLLRQAQERGERMAAQRSPLVSAAAGSDFGGGYVRSFFESSLDEDLPGALDPPLWPFGRPRGPADDGEATAQDSGTEGFPTQEALVPPWLARMLSGRPVPLNDLSVEPMGTDLSRYELPGVTWGTSGGRLWARRSPGSTSPTEAPAVVSSDLAGGLSREVGRLRRALLGLAFVGLTGLPIVAAWFLAKRVLLVDLAPNRRYAAADKILNEVTRRRRRGQRILVQTSLPRAIERMAAGKAFEDYVHVIRFAEAWASGGDTVDAKTSALLQPLDVEERSSGRAAKDGYRSLVITDFRPNLDDPVVAEAQIAALETIRTHGTGPAGRSMLLVIDRSYDTLTHLAEGVAEDDDTADRQREREAKDRWSAFLSRFSLRYARDEGKIRMFESWIEWKIAWLNEGYWPSQVEPAWYSPHDEPVRDGAGGARGDTRFKCPPAWPAQSGVSAEEAEALRRMRRHRKLLHVILEECRWTWRLQRIGIDIVREIEAELPMRSEEETADQAPTDEAWNPPTRHQLRSRIEFAALPYYTRIWDRCEPGEKLVLHQFAHHGVANPKNFDRILDLLNRGLVVRTVKDPVLRLMNRSFGSFIRRTVRQSEAWSWEEEEGMSAWSVWKWVLPIPLLLLAAFLFVTQQDALSNVVGLVIAVSSLVPTAMNLYGYFQKLNVAPHGAR